MQLLRDHGGPLTLQRVAVTLFQGSWPWAVALFLPLALLLFPDGRLPSARWRPVAWSIVLTSPLFVLEAVADASPVHPGSTPGYSSTSSYESLAPLWAVSGGRRQVRGRTIADRWARGRGDPAGAFVIRVLVCDGHPVVRAGLSALLGSLPDIEVVAVVADGQSAVREVVTVRPEVAILDLSMPGLDGIAATRQIARAAPQVAVLVLAMYDDESVFAAMRAGARGYLVKGVEQDDLLRAIRSVAAGEAIVGPGIAQRVLGFLTAPPRLQSAVPFPELTPRESDVLDLLAAGLDNAAIAKRPEVSPKTVANHVSAIFVKLQVADRAQAIVRARDAGLGRR